jgi:hypothetical protein
MLTKNVRTQMLFKLMPKHHHRQGRTGAGVRKSRRAHARLLLLALADISSHMKRRLRDKEARAAYTGVERALRRLGRKERS